MKKLFIFTILLWSSSLYTLQTQNDPTKVLVHTRIKRDWLGKIVAYEYWFVDKGSDYAVAFYERPTHKIMTDVNLIKKEGPLEVPKTTFAGTCPRGKVGYLDTKNEMMICGIGNIEIIEIPAEARDQICD